jgi:phosphonate transport system substrate-binding protein
MRLASMARWTHYACCLCAGLVALSSAVKAAATDPEQKAVLELGIAPFLPAHTLVRNYQPLRAYLEQQLGKPVLFVTAPDYRSFHERVLRREYPVIIAIASTAYLANTEAGYVPMLRPQVGTSPVLVVSKQGSLTGVQELRGKTVALPDPLAIISMQAKQRLRESGLEPGNGVRLRHLPTHSAAVNHVLSGEAAAAIVSDRALAQMPAATREGLRTIRKWEQDAVPGIVYLAHPDLPPERTAQLTREILKFVRDIPQGRDFIKMTGYGDLVPATLPDLQRLAPYAELFRQELAIMKPEQKGDETPSPQ